MLRLFAALLLLVWSSAAFPAKHGNYDQPDQPDASHAVDSAPVASGNGDTSAADVGSCAQGKKGIDAVLS